MFRLTKPLCWLLIVAMTSLSLPRTPAHAAMVPTEAVVEQTAAEQTAVEQWAAAASDRQRIRALVERTEVRSQLEAHGIEPDEALARIDSLSDREVAEIAAQLDRLPAGGYSAGAIEGMVILIMIGLVVIVVLGVVWIVKLIVE